MTERFENEGPGRPDDWIELRDSKRHKRELWRDLSYGSTHAEEGEHGMESRHAGLRRAELAYRMMRRTILPSWAQERRRHLKERRENAIAVLKTTVDVSPDSFGGVPLLKGSRIPVARVLAELAEDRKPSEIADELSLDPRLLTQMLTSLAIFLDWPLTSDEDST